MKIICKDCGCETKYYVHIDIDKLCFKCAAERQLKPNTQEGGGNIGYLTNNDVQSTKPDRERKRE